MTKYLLENPDYTHTLTHANHLLHSVCRSHYSLKYEQWKEIFDDILEQVAFDEEEDRGYDSTLSYFDQLASEDN